MKTYKEYSRELESLKTNEGISAKSASAAVGKLNKIYSQLIATNDSDERIKLTAKIGKLSVSYIKTLEERIIALELRLDGGKR